MSTSYRRRVVCKPFTVNNGSEIMLPSLSSENWGTLFRDRTLRSRRGVTQERERLSPDRLTRFVSPRSQTENESGLGPLPGVTGSEYFLFTTFLLIRFRHHLIIIWLKSFPLKNKHLSSLLGEHRRTWFFALSDIGSRAGHGPYFIGPLTPRCWCPEKVAVHLWSLFAELFSLFFSLWYKVPARFGRSVPWFDFLSRMNHVISDNRQLFGQTGQTLQTNDPTGGLFLVRVVIVHGHMPMAGEQFAPRWPVTVHSFAVRSPRMESHLTSVKLAVSPHLLL